MTRIVSGPLLSGQVYNSSTGAPLAGVVVTPAGTVYSNPEMTAVAATLTTNGIGVFTGYAQPGTYTFTTTEPLAAPIEPIEILSADEGTQALTAAVTTAITAEVLRADTAYVPVAGQPPGLTLADTQLLARSDAAGGLVPVYPTGTSELAYAENNTTTTQAAPAAPTAALDVTGCSITVPASARPVYLVACLYLGSITGYAVGRGATMTVAEVGGLTESFVDIQPLLTSSTTKLHIGWRRLAASVASDRVFKLQIQLSAGVTANVENGAGGMASYIGAFAG